MRGFAGVMLLTLSLVGCASIQPLPRSEVEQSLPSTWTLQGRIGIQSSEQSVSGQVLWQHRDEIDEILVTSPLGQGVARIVRSPAGVALDLPNQPTRRAPDADTLTREALGYVLPVAGLTWWVQARPDPGDPFEATRDAVGRLAQLRQNGWVIDYLQYADDMPTHPRKLAVSREGLEIRLVADSWQTE